MKATLVTAPAARQRNGQPRSLRALGPILVLLFLATACGVVTKPHGWAPPVIDEETLYVSLDAGELTALNAEAEPFEEIWTFGSEDEFACGDGEEEKHDLEGIYGAPVVGDDLVFIGAYDGSAYAVGKEDGVCQWEFETDDPVVGGFVLDGDRLYVPSSDGNLYVLDPATGDQVDVFAAGDIQSTPLLTADGLIVGTMGGLLWKLEPAELQAVWDGPFQVSAALLTNPTPAGDNAIVVGGIGQTLYRVDASSGDKLWSVDASNWFWGTPAIDDAHVYATNLSGTVIAVDLASGDEVWSFDTAAPIRAGAAVAGGTVVVVNEDGTAYGLDALTGETKWGPTELNEGVAADPLVVEDRVLIVSRKGSLFSIDPESGVPTEVVS